MSKVFEVDTDLLRSHAKAMGAVGTDIGSAKSVVTTAVSNDAFGVMCQFLATPVNQAGRDAIKAIEGLGHIADNASAGVLAMAITYEVADLMASLGIKLVGGGL